MTKEVHPEFFSTRLMSYDTAHGLCQFYRPARKRGSGGDGLDFSRSFRLCYPYGCGRRTLVLKGRFFFGLLIVAAVIFQIAAAYISVEEVLAGNFVAAFLYFLLVPGLGLVIGLYYSRVRGNAHRKQED
jgi:hypothetical protein